MKKDIRSKAVRESLLDYETLANSLKENTASTVEKLLSETVRNTYAKLLSEDDDKDYEEEVEDTETFGSSDDAEGMDDSSVDGTDDGQVEKADAVETTDDVDGGQEETVEASDEVDADGGEDSEWAEFDKYKGEDGAYDLSNANDEDIVKVYKLMKDEDNILFKKDGDKLSITDNNAGTEYLIDLGGGQESSEEGVEVDAVNTNDFEDMKESTQKTYELVLEYDSNVGYTDKYQKKDVMTNDGMSEPGKDVNDWDAGVPKGTEKPWSGYPSKKNKADKPFNDKKGKQVEEQVEECGTAPAPKDEIEESAGECGARMGAKGRMMGTKTHKPNSGKKNAPMNQHHTSIAGTYEGNPQNEQLARKVNKALEENKKLKGTLTSVMAMLKEAAVTNLNLGQIVKLISENSTTKDEKKEIVNRFMNEAKTEEQSWALYKTLSNDLKKSTRMDINENAGSNLTADDKSKINETKIYLSQDMLDSLDLMHRVSKMN